MPYMLFTDISHLFLDVLNDRTHLLFPVLQTLSLPVAVMSVNLYLSLTIADPDDSIAKSFKDPFNAGSYFEIVLYSAICSSI